MSFNLKLLNSFGVLEINLHDAMFIVWAVISEKSSTKTARVTAHSWQCSLTIAQYHNSTINTAIVSKLIYLKWNGPAKSDFL